MARNKAAAPAKPAAKIADVVETQSSATESEIFTFTSSVSEESAPTLIKKKVTSLKNSAPVASTSIKCPSFVEMVKLAIIAEGDNTGLSRQAIKAFITDKWGKAPQQVATYVGKAITNGVADGVFTLPKGVSGKVKLRTPPKGVPAAKSDSAAQESDVEVEDSESSEDEPPKKKTPKKAGAKTVAAKKKATAGEKLSPKKTSAIKKKVPLKVANKKTPKKAASKVRVQSGGHSSC